MLKKLTMINIIKLIEQHLYSTKDQGCNIKKMLLKTIQTQLLGLLLA